MGLFLLLAGALALAISLSWNDREYLAGKYLKKKPVYAKVGDLVVYKEDYEGLKQDAALAGIAAGSEQEKILAAQKKLYAAKKLRVFPADTDVKLHCQDVYGQPYGSVFDASGKETPLPANTFVRYSFDNNAYIRLACRAGKSELDIQDGGEEKAAQFNRLYGRVRVKVYE